jgi:hypothetical protein
MFLTFYALLYKGPTDLEITPEIPLLLPPVIVTEGSCIALPPVLPLGAIYI